MAAASAAASQGGPGHALAPAAFDGEQEHPAKFRLGIVTYNIAANWDLPTILRICKAVGLSPVELRTTHKHGVEPTMTKDQRKEVRQRFADAGIECWGCGSVCEFHSPDPAVVRQNIETCKQFVQLAADIGGRGAKVRPNGLPKEVPVEKTLEQIGQALIECGKAAADAGVEIWVEVHGSGTSQPANMKTIMEHCGHPKVGLTWNSNPTDIVKAPASPLPPGGGSAPGHRAGEGGGSVADSFKLLWPWIRSCHINELYKDSTGVYPYRELFRLFREHGYDRVTLCEVGRTPPDPDAGQELLRYYKAIWAELNR
jgi:sugar phosphate isomerase/epimerase